MASTPPISQPVPDEPFGQTGVRGLLLPLASALSLLIMLVGIFFWIRGSYFRDQIGWVSGRTEYTVGSFRGALVVGRSDFTESDARINTGLFISARRTLTRSDFARTLNWRRLGIEWRPDPVESDAEGGWSLRILWRNVVIVALILPTAHIVVRRRKRSRELDI